MSWYSRFRDLIPKSLRLNNSFSWLIPSWFKSRQIFNWLNSSSLASTFASLLLSKSARASNPCKAFSPFSSWVLSPNTSVPSLIIPSPFRSKTSKPSSDLTQPVATLRPSASLSKKAPFVLLCAIVSIPSPSKSKTNGS